MKNKIFIFALVVMLIALTGAVMIPRIQRGRQRKAAWIALEKKIKQRISNSGLEAAVVVKDLATGRAIRINDVKLFASASLVKVPIMASCILAASQGKFNLRDSLVLKGKYQVLGSGILKSYAPGTEFKLYQLIEVMIAQSDNTAANMLIDYVGMDKLNDYFGLLGLTRTNLARKMMDFKKRKKGIENYTSADDQAYLLELIYKNKLANEAFSRSCLGVLKKQKIRDRIPALLPKEVVVAHKTGLEKGVCHDAGIVFTPRGDFIICVLTRHRNKVARPAKKFIAQLALDVYNYYRS